MAGEVNVGTLKATLTIDGTQYELGLKKAAEQTKQLDTSSIIIYS